MNNIGKIKLLGVLILMFTLGNSLSVSAAPNETVFKINSFKQNSGSIGIMQNYLKNNGYQLKSKAEPGERKVAGKQLTVPYTEEVYEKHFDKFAYHSDIAYSASDLVLVELSVTAHDEEIPMEQIVDELEKEVKKFDGIFQENDKNEIYSIIAAEKIAPGFTNKKTSNIEMIVFAEKGKIVMKVLGIVE